MADLNSSIEVTMRASFCIELIATILNQTTQLIVLAEDGCKESPWSGSSHAGDANWSVLTEPGWNPRSIRGSLLTIFSSSAALIALSMIVHSENVSNVFMRLMN